MNFDKEIAYLRAKSVTVHSYENYIAAGNLLSDRSIWYQLEIYTREPMIIVWNWRPKYSNNVILEPTLDLGKLLLYTCTDDRKP